MNPKRKTNQSRSFSVKTIKQKQEDHANLQTLRIDSNNIFRERKKSNQQIHQFSNEFINQNKARKIESRNKQQYLKLRYNRVHSKEIYNSKQLKTSEIQKSAQLCINLLKVDGSSEQMMLIQQNSSADNKQKVKKFRPKSSRRNLLNLGAQNFILPNSNNELDGQKQKIKAFWKSQNKFVSLHISQNVMVQQFQHENILKLFGYIKLRNVNYVVVQAEGTVSLAQLASEFGNFQENGIRRMLVQITEGLLQLHSRQYYHNNISLYSLFSHRSGRIMIDPILIQPKWQPPLAFSSPKSSKGCAKISDLLEVQLSEQEQKKLNIYYRPPQMLLKSSNSYEKGDVWAIGVLALELVMGSIDKDQNYHPYNVYARRAVNKQKLIKKSVQDRLLEKVFQKYKSQFHKKKELNNQRATDSYESLEQIPILSQKLFNLINSCLRLQESKRLSLNQVRQHPFLKQNQKN